MLFCSCVFNPFNTAITSLGKYVCSICASSVLSVFSSSWCLERAAACDCDTLWTFFLPVYVTVSLPGLFSYLFSIPTYGENAKHYCSPNQRSFEDEPLLLNIGFSRFTRFVQMMILR